MPTTRVIITNDGRVLIEGVGYVGDACLADLQRILDTLRAFGIEAKVEVQQRKPEALVSTPVAQNA